MDKVISETLGAFYQHYPKVAAVVTACAAGNDNAMAVAWHMPISQNPPLYCVVVSPKRFTYELIADSKEFGINFMPDTKAELVAAVGGSKGNEMDKFKAFSIAKDNPIKTAAPILKAAYAAYECQLVDDRLYGDHRLLIGEIVAVHYLEEAFMDDGILNLDKVSPVLYLGNEQYLSVAECRVRTLNREFCVGCLKA